MASTTQRKGPAEVAASAPSRVSHIQQGNENMSTVNTAPADPAIPPTAADYAAAFYGLEDPIQQLLRHAKVCDYLASILTDTLEKSRHPDHDLADLVYGQVADLRQEIDTLDTAFLAKFNDLVGRENVARGFPG